MIKGIAEILRETSDIPSRPQKIEFLRQHDSKQLRMILRGAFVEAAKWALPEGKIPYTPTKDVDREHVLYSEARRLYIFLEGESNVSATKRLILFIELLEQLAPEDAELLLAVKDKTIPYKGITAKLIEAAFPGLLD